MLTRRRRFAPQLAAALALFACVDEPTAPPSEVLSPSRAATRFEDGLLSPQWQQRARTLVAANNPNPIAAGRVYAALSVAQYQATVAVDQHLDAEGTASDNGFAAGGRSRWEAHRGAVSAASAEVLSFFFAAAAGALEDQVDADAQSGVGRVHPAFARGVEIGRRAGEAMIELLKTDGSSLPWTGTIPVGEGYWIASGPPAGANLGGVRPYLLESTSQFRPPMPPAFGSAAFNADLDEVIAIAASRTAEQIASAHFWAFAGPTSTPLGFWNELAAAYVQDAGLSERMATYVFALMHAAQFDAQLACFEAKYFYFTIRPYQVVTFDLLLPRPNHPSYPSGHSCISASAARVLEHFFPARTAELSDLVIEAGNSRIYAGIHYRFDTDAGKALGTAVAEWAISHEQGLR